jgi:hypothetical protein
MLVLVLFALDDGCSEGLLWSRYGDPSVGGLKNWWTPGWASGMVLASAWFELMVLPSERWFELVAVVGTGLLATALVYEVVGLRPRTRRLGSRSFVILDSVFAWGKRELDDNLSLVAVAV